MNSKKRKEAVLEALRRLGGRATTRQIAEKAGLNVNGVSQTLGFMGDEQVRMGDYKRGDTEWTLI